MATPYRRLALRPASFDGPSTDTPRPPPRRSPLSDDRPFEDTVPDGPDGGFTLPARKWREIVFVGALKPDADGLYTRDPARPLPPLREPDLFPAGRRFRVERLPEPPSARADPANPRRRDRSRVRLTPVDRPVG